MSRTKFVASLSEDVRKRLINNIIDSNNSVDFLDQWMSKEMDDNGIRGAFTASTTREGYAYWGRVNASIKK